MGEQATTAQRHLVLPLVERAHGLIEALRTRGTRPIGSRRLAADLGVGQRTVERDIARLRDAGIPVEVVRGPGGGYRLPVRAHPEPVKLTTGEISALLAALAAVGPYTSATALSARDALLAALTDPSSR